MFGEIDGLRSVVSNGDYSGFQIVPVIELPLLLLFLQPRIVHNNTWSGVQFTYPEKEFCWDVVSTTIIEVNCYLFFVGYVFLHCTAK